MNCRERESHARGEYLTQDTTRMGTGRMQREKEADIRILKKAQEIWKKERLHKGEMSQTKPIWC